MANVTVRHLIDLAIETLQDADNVDWTESALVYWYNMGCRECVHLKPDANAQIEIVKLAVGAQQSAPAGSIVLLNVIRNMGIDGLTPGKGITRIDVNALAVFDRSWSLSANQSAETLNWAPDDETTFHVNPPSDGTNYVEIQVSKVPNQVIWDGAGAWESELVGVADDYVFPVLNFILSCAYMKASDIPGNDALATKHFNLFLGGLGIQPNSRQKPQV